MQDIFPILSDKNFEEVIKANKKILIIFSSSICGQCVIAKKNLQKILVSLKDLVVFECQVEEAPIVTQKYKISGLPQMKLFLNGEVVYTAFGIRNPQDLYYDLKMF